MIIRWLVIDNTVYERHSLITFLYVTVELLFKAAMYWLDPFGIVLYFVTYMYVEIETSVGKRSFIMNLRIKVTTTHMVDKLEKDSHL